MRALVPLALAALVAAACGGTPSPSASASPLPSAVVASAPPSPASSPSPASRSSMPSPEASGSPGIAASTVPCPQAVHKDGTAPRAQLTGVAVANAARGQYGRVHVRWCAVPDRGRHPRHPAVPSRSERPPSRRRGFSVLARGAPRRHWHRSRRRGDVRRTWRDPPRRQPHRRPGPPRRLRGGLELGDRLGCRYLPPGCLGQRADRGRTDEAVTGRGRRQLAGNSSVPRRATAIRHIAWLVAAHAMGARPPPRRSVRRLAACAAATTGGQAWTIHGIGLADGSDAPGSTASLRLEASRLTGRRATPGTRDGSRLPRRRLAFRAEFAKAPYSLLLRAAGWVCEWGEFDPTEVPATVSVLVRSPLQHDGRRGRGDAAMPRLPLAAPADMRERSSRPSDKEVQPRLT